MKKQKAKQQSSKPNGPTNLLTACSEGNLDALERILETKEVDLELPDKHGATGLIQAAARGHVAVVSRLIGAGANVAAADDDGETALSYAVANAHTEVIETLIRAGANPNSSFVVGDLELSVLDIACVKGVTGVVRQLLSAGADPNISCSDFLPLGSAAKHEDPEMVALLLKHGADPNLASHGFFPLYIAAARGRLENVKLLLKARAEPNAINRYGLTALWKAAANGHLDVVTMLIEGGARSDIRGERVHRFGVLPIQAAKEKGHGAIVEFLQNHKNEPSRPSVAVTAARRYRKTR
jgi:ankyrin repeat protein